MSLATALVLGPLTIQSEMLAAYIQTDNAAYDNLCFGGWYVQGGYFLTGETRPYNTGGGAFGRVVPKANFQSNGQGWGAWEVAARYSYLDLDDESLDERMGSVNSVTLGVNWYLNPTTRITFNYVRSCFEIGPDGTDNATDVAMMRFHWEF